MAPTPRLELDAKLERLDASKTAWAAVEIPGRIALLRECMDATIAVSEQWVDSACQAKGIGVASDAAGEEWLGGPFTVARNLRCLIEALEANGRPKLAGVHAHKNGQVIARVFPSSITDKLLFTGVTCDVWIEPGKGADQGRLYRDKAHGNGPEPQVSLVLGAGNVASIGPMDALHKLFVEDEVVLLKTNPVNAYLGPWIEKAFAPLAAKGVFDVCHGGAEVGAYLCEHPLVHSIHITGSDATHDAIVWGVDSDERAHRKAAGTPKNERPITSELGCVTPVMIVPGDWSEADLNYHATNVASMVTNNASFNCNAAKIVVTAEGWPQRERFMEKLRAELASVPARKAYYPGARERYEAFLEHYPDAERLGEDDPAVVPWTLLPNIGTSNEEYALNNEAFCGVLADTVLPAATAAEFMEKATTFANDQCWGTLSCMVLIHPKTESANQTGFDTMLETLRYGGIAVNCWAAMIYGLVVAPWGAFPGHPLEDIRSGRGFVHNTTLLDHVQKSVVRAPFKMMPKPVYFHSHSNVSALAKKLLQFEKAPSLLKVPGVAAQAMRG
ncbi:MAG: hypothetical protein ACI81R_002241 [Bradymonadia bacterium]|jgi:hypothetical protein